MICMDERVGRYADVQMYREIDRQRENKRLIFGQDKSASVFSI